MPRSLRSPRWRHGLAAMLGLLLVTGVTGVCSADDAAAVADYRTLKSHLETGRVRQAEAALERLLDTPLAAYARLSLLRARLDTVSPDRVEGFLADYPELPARPAFRVAWLRELADRADWARLAAAYQGERDVHVRCAVVQARAALGQTQAAIDLALELWDVGYRQPQSCVPAFELLEREGALTNARVRERIRRALAAGHADLAAAYVDRLPPADQREAEARIALVRDPEQARTLAPERLGDADSRSGVLATALAARARTDPAAARALWQAVRDRFNVDENTAYRIERRIALEAAYDRHPDALAWLMAVPERHATATVHAWRVRAALRAGDWGAVAEATDRMPADQQAQPRWRYWRGIALRNGGDDAGASRALRDGAGAFSFYGFLAADAVDAPYYWGDAMPGADAARQEALRDAPGLRRAGMLVRAGEHDWAASEWRRFTRRLERPDRLAAARIALAEGWPWAAMYASAIAGVDNASFLRFPLGFRDTVNEAAADQGTGVDWLLGLIRQESAFRQTSCSHAGACGLTQLMPGTARWMLERMGEATDGVDAARADPEQNIAIGSAYLDYLLGRFEHPVLALAAYNAGPGNVARWLEEGGPPPATPRWVETLPFGETREYLKAVLFNRVVYRLRLKGHTERLSAVFRADSPVRGGPTQLADRR